MGIRVCKPTTPGQRGMSYLTYEEITTSKPHKPLLVAKKNYAGRNVHGRITVRHRGGGVKRHIRKVDFDSRDKLNIPCKVETIEYDPNRTTNIALVCYADGERRYVLAPQGIAVGDKWICQEKAPVKTGNRMFIGNIPPGVEIYNIETTKGKGGQIARSAGQKCVLASQEGEYSLIKMPSGRTRFVLKSCLATVGKLGNEDWGLVKIGKAGRKRKMGWRPTVRGSVMNPCDHVHGGGEGKCPIGRKQPRTANGKFALGVKTRKKKYSDKWLADLA
jgi:large subunit ribosomal protein L2